MRKINKIKLNQLSRDELDRRMLNALKGGCDCTYGGTSCGPCWGYVTELFNMVDAQVNREQEAAY